jgi:hypothetical protein
MCITGCSKPQPPRDDCHVDEPTGLCNDPKPWGCCTLATHKECAYPGTDKSSYTCIAGYWQQHWICKEGGKTRYCGECIRNKIPSCFGGNLDQGKDPDYACSIWWDT